MTKGHLVQIKRAEGEPSRWTIDIKQLFDILEHDESATYWLLSSHPAAVPSVSPLPTSSGWFGPRSRARGPDVTQ